MTVFYVLGLERFIACQRLQIDGRQWRLWGLTKRPHMHACLWLPCFPQHLGIQVRDLRFPVWRDDLTTVSRPSASLETQPLTPTALGDQSCLNVASSKNDAAFDNDDDSGKDWAQN